MAGTSRTLRSSKTKAAPTTAAGKKAASLAAAIAAAPSVTPSSASSPAPSAGSAADALPTLQLADAAAWESWLEAHHVSAQAGVWLKIAKKSAAIQTVTYDAALDLALCFGWIDGQRKAHDATFFLQRFTPRRKNSLWSKRNVEKVSLLQEAGRMRDAGRAEVDTAIGDGRWGRAYAGSGAMEVPEDFRVVLEGNPRASAFFEGLGKTQRYSFLWRIETTRRAETRVRRIGEMVEMLASGRTFARG